MPIIRVNADGTMPVPHGSAGSVPHLLERAAQIPGPVIVMIHGFKYQPHNPRHCPHRRILALHPVTSCTRAKSWPRRLGFGVGLAQEGLAIAFGWNARGLVWQAQARARAAGRALAHLIQALHAANPHRQVHLVAHSMGTVVATEALAHVPVGSVSRIVSMTGAAYAGDVADALATPAGGQTEFFNIISRENDAFDFLFESLLPPRHRGDQSIGRGFEADNAVTVQIDCPATLRHLGGLGVGIGAPEARICHWSAYTRPGVLRFYNALLRRPDELPLHRLRMGVPAAPDPRWSRLFDRPALPAPLPFLTNAS